MNLSKKDSSSCSISIISSLSTSTSKEDYPRIVANARKCFNSGRTRDINFRKQQLKNLKRFLKENEDAICESCYKDLRKPRHEAKMMEVASLNKEIDFYLRNLDDFVRPEKQTNSLSDFFDGLYVYNEPYGVVLILGAWNYPVQVILNPLIGAIAAGNCAVLKPSEISHHTSQLLADCLPNYIDEECFPVCLGGANETSALLKEKFDYIFYTGSTSIGRIIYETAAKSLTPVTLEMGGKSPVYIDDNVDLELAVKRIVWGKFINAGQTCVAPDYVLCSRDVQERFLPIAKRRLKEMFGDNIQKSEDFGRMISPKHFNRVSRLIDSKKVAIGGQTDECDLYISPTILANVSAEDDVMKEEIFGPILPIVVVNNEREAIEFINARAKPLAMYLFTKSKKIREYFLSRTSAGGVTVNDTIMHVTPLSLPFGGVGDSGIGAYHGKYTFDTFSHKKSVMTKGFSLLLEQAMFPRYAPYTQNKTKIFELALKFDRMVSFKYVPHVCIFIMGIICTIGVYYIVNCLNERD